MWPFIWPLKIGRAMHLSSVRVAGAAAKHKDVWFWPDLATCHYSNNSQAQMTAQDIQYITRDVNPPNAPRICPICQFSSKKFMKTIGVPKIVIN